MSRGRLANTNYPQKRKTSKNKLVLETQEKQVVRVEPNIRKKFSQHDLKKVTPLTDNQLNAMREWGQGQHLVLEGWPGVGKTFLALHMALQTVLNPETSQDKIIITRSATPTKDVGHLPGDLSDKLAAYEDPYVQICDQLFTWKNSYRNLKEIGLIEFVSTSYLRGTNFDSAIVIFDEYQGATTPEIDTVLTRISGDSRLIVCGDALHQNDIGHKSGGSDMLKILRKMDEVSFIDFGINDMLEVDL
jgi:phosphate starvation-inducible protein PhoH